MKKGLQPFFHLLAAFFGSAAEFKREWRHCGQTAQEKSAMEGCWSGEWVSDANGHRGDLKCILKEAGAKQVSALFHATYWKILRVSYKVTLDRNECDGHAGFYGKADLGALAGGVYDYEGDIKDDHLECKYSCKYDHGKFHLDKLKKF